MPINNNCNIAELFDFLSQLRDNNNRQWFAEHKQQYQELHAQWLTDLQQLISLMSQFQPSLRGVQAKDCAYRIYRDIRFSPDKTPYKTYFSALIGPHGRKTLSTAFYLHLEPGTSALYTSLWCPDPDTLRQARSLIDAEQEELSQLLSNEKFQATYEFSPMQTLKRIPQGYSANHPLEAILRAKDFTWGCRKDNRFFTRNGWIEDAADIFHTAKPLADFFDYLFE